MLSAHDDEARWLSEEEPAEPGPLPARRLVSVAGDGPRSGSGTGSERVYDVEADGGVRANLAGQDTTDDLLEALDSARGVRPEQGPATPSRDQPSPSSSSSPSSAAPRVDALVADPPPAHPADSSPEDVVDRTVLPVPEPSEEDGQEAAQQAEAEAPAAEPAVEPVAQPAEEPAVEPEPAAAADGPAPDPRETPAEPRRRNRSARRGSAAAKRPSVPSWDDIMFGTKKD